MGFDGTAVTPHIKELIEKRHLGCILLTAKNLKCEKHMSQSGSVWLASLLICDSRRGHYQAVL